MRTNRLQSAKNACSSQRKRIAIRNWKCLGHRMLWDWSPSQLVIGYYLLTFLIISNFITEKKLTKHSYCSDFFPMPWNTFQNILRRRKFSLKKCCQHFFSLKQKDSRVIFFSDTFLTIAHHTAFSHILRGWGRGLHVVL